MPLVHGGAETEVQHGRLGQKARKIKPQYAEGSLVKVHQVHNQTEGEFVQQLLLEEGIPSMLRRTAGFDVPDFLAAGPRDVIVAESGMQAAREVLLKSELARPPDQDMTAPHTQPVAVIGWLLAGVIVLAFLLALMRLL